ncbi:MAG: glycosyltransferase family 4 protein [Chloroflexi bacterium]|nr:glycosyltransferase family 4 protein [Chloroflexota bacterium]
MRILMLSWEFPPHNVGGLGKHVTELIPALAFLGEEIHLVTPRQNGGEVQEVVATPPPGNGVALRFPPTVYRVDPYGVPETSDFYSSVTRLNQQLERQGQELIEQAGPFDLIHVHDWLVAFAGIGLKHRHKLPLLATIHATEYGRNRGTIRGDAPRAIHSVEWQLTYEAWRVICCSQFMANEVRTAFQTPVDKIDVIPNGIDTSPFDRYDGLDLSDLRRQYAEPDEPIIFSVGRIVYEKGLHLLAEAMPQVLAEFPRAKLLIAGTGGYRDALARDIRDLDLGDRVRLLGFIPDDVRNRLLRVADAAVFPSVYEPFGIVALEAMAARAPVVAATVGGLAEVVQHLETGITVYPDSAASLAWGILHTLHRPDLARARAATAYRTVVAEYNWQRIAERTRAIYGRIVAERAAAHW